MYWKVVNCFHSNDFLVRRKSESRNLLIINWTNALKLGTFQSEKSLALKLTAILWNILIRIADVMIFWSDQVLLIVLPEKMRIQMNSLNWSSSSFWSKAGIQRIKMYNTAWFLSKNDSFTKSCSPLILKYHLSLKPLFEKRCFQQLNVSQDNCE